MSYNNLFEVHFGLAFLCTFFFSETLAFWHMEFNRLVTSMRAQRLRGLPGIITMEIIDQVLKQSSFQDMHLGSVPNGRLPYLNYAQEKQTNGDFQQAHFPRGFPQKQVFSSRDRLGYRSCLSGFSFDSVPQTAGGVGLIPCSLMIKIAIN